MQLAERCRSDSRGSRVRWVDLAGAGAEVDDRVDVGDAGLLKGNTVELAVRYVRNRASNYSPLTERFRLSSGVFLGIGGGLITG